MVLLRFGKTQINQVAMCIGRIRHYNIVAGKRSSTGLGIDPTAFRMVCSITGHLTFMAISTSGWQLYETEQIRLRTSGASY